MKCLLELSSDAEMDNTSEYVVGLLTVSRHFSWEATINPVGTTSKDLGRYPVIHPEMMQRGL